MEFISRQVRRAYERITAKHAKYSKSVLAAHRRGPSPWPARSKYKAHQGDRECARRAAK